jgi:hypothetical protein
MRVLILFCALLVLAASKELITNLTKQNYEKFFASSTNVVVKFTIPDCEPWYSIIVHGQ